MKAKTVVALFVFILAFFAAANVVTIGINIFFNTSLPTIKVNDAARKLHSAQQNTADTAAQHGGTTYTEAE